MRPTIRAPAARAPGQAGGVLLGGHGAARHRPAPGGRDLARHVDEVLDGEAHPRARRVEAGDEGRVAAHVVGVVGVAVVTVAPGGSWKSDDAGDAE